MNDGIAGKIGIGFTQVSPPLSSGYSWASSPAGKTPDPVGASVFGTFEQTIFKPDSGSNVNSINFAGGDPFTVSGKSVTYVVNLDFSQYDATSKGAPGLGTFTGTFIGFSGLATGDQKTTVTVRGTTVSGTPATDFQHWDNYVAGALSGHGPGNSAPWNGFQLSSDSSGLTLSGTSTRAALGTTSDGVGTSTTMSWLNLSPEERYKTLSIEVTTTATSSGTNPISVYVGTVDIVNDPGTGTPTTR